MRIVGLEPYYGGSHKLFIDTLAARSSHDWRILSMKPRKWKWRMLHSGANFAEEATTLLHSWNNESANVTEERSEACERTCDDVVFFATDMMNVAEFKGLLPSEFSSIPVVFYFHENQLTYPNEYPKDGDRMFGWINILSAYAADEVWFNSKYHMDVFFEACQRFLRKTPDARPLHMTEAIMAKSSVLHQGVESFPVRCGIREPGPLRVLWAARWEHDKNPALFFEALTLARDAGMDFRLSILGDDPNRGGELFEKMRIEFDDRIDHWGFLPSRSDYEDVLMTADVAVSTADHEFFGVALGEAVSAGVFPLAPCALAYPELLDAYSSEPSPDNHRNDDFFHDGTAANIADKLAILANKLDNNECLWGGSPERGRDAVARFDWTLISNEADARLKRLGKSSSQ